MTDHNDDRITATEAGALLGISSERVRQLTVAKVLRRYPPTEQLPVFHYLRADVLALAESRAAALKGGRRGHPAPVVEQGGAADLCS